ncbi:MtrB/PioB family decaheme-associated outer membrane protein [Aromatoleum sp.]|uniref:MtrB/PioB family decaheme-associated outer membrane protein n=1 Tax=Aromatoleum sp. TaxID=2307007 RepID=UPI002FCA0BB9
MSQLKTVRVASLTALAASFAAAFGSAYAEDDEITRLIRPESSVTLGIGYLTDDAARFGQYTGLKDMGLYGIGSVDYVRRDDPTGTWYRLSGRNLGLQSRELRVEHERQGDWRYSLEYNQIPRFSQYEVNTGLQGLGHEVQTVRTIAPGTGFDKRLKTEREGVTLAGQKMLGNGLDVQVRFKNETKEGRRLFGDRTISQAFLAEPIDHTMKQVDVILGYTGKNLQLSGGYYGSFFNNENSALQSFNGNLIPPTSLGLIALPPDNEAHQFYLTGGYSFSPTTRGNFKVARGVATQNDSFVNPALPAVGRTDLGGRVETTLVQAGVTARPMPKLSLLANFKYEDRDDETHERMYFTQTTTRNGFNERPSMRSHLGKVEASYLLPADFRLTGGVDYDARRRTVNPLRQVTFREETDETSYRIELRRSLSETVNGSVAYIHSDRDGSSLDVMSVPAVPGTTAVPLHLADRERDKVRLKLDWVPVDPLSVQLMADFSDDSYDRDTYGLDKGKAQFWSLDASYAITDEWQGLAWVSRDYSRVVNSTRGSGTGIPLQDWAANLRLLSQAFGLGFRGSLGSSWKVGGDFQYSHDRSSYGLTGTATPLTSLPDVKYTLRTLKLFAEYEMRQDLSLRFDAVHDRWNTNDWLWTNYVYSDGTRLSQDDSQKATFVGVSMRYAWR